MQEDEEEELEYASEMEYHTPPMAIQGLIEGPPQIRPIDDLEITRGGFDEARLEETAISVAEEALADEESSAGEDVEAFIVPVSS